MEAEATANRDMDGSSRLKQHDNVHQQVAAFEKLLQHAINRFSSEKLHQMMHVVLESLPYIPQPKHSRASHADEVSDEVSSLEHLREILVEFKNPRRRGIKKDEETHVIKYFDAFFEDISYLKSLKHYFDERVYICLYDYFYEPEDDLLDPREVLKRERRGKVTFVEDPDSGNSSLPGSDEDKQAPNPLVESQEETELEIYYNKLNDSEKLSIAVRKMFQINNRWDALFDESDVDASLFDSDSRHEILQFANYEQFEKLFRLVPDLFVKAYKSVELAKLWWTQANKIYEVLPQKITRKRSEKEISARVELLEKKLMNVRFEIKRHEELLVLLNDDLDHLKGRENRYVSLSVQCEKLENRKNDMGDRYNTILEQRDLLRNNLEKLNPYSRQYQETSHELKSWERKFFDAQVALRMLTFQFQLIQSDFLIELEARPDLIRFQVDIETRIGDAKETIWSKGEEARDSEKRLTLLKTNCERMRLIMRRVLRTKDEENKEDGKKYRKKANDGRKESKENVDADHKREQKREALDKLNVANRKHRSKSHDRGTQGQGQRDATEKVNSKRNGDDKKRYEDRSGWFDEGRKEKVKDKKKEKSEKSTEDDSSSKGRAFENNLESGDDGNDADTDTPTPIANGRSRYNAYGYTYDAR